MAFETIKLKKYSDNITEYVAAAAIIPGALVAPVAAAAATITNHATAGGNVIPMFALGNTLEGKGIGDDYASGDQVQVWIPYRGDEVNALLSTNQHIAIGDFLESDGAGKLQKWAGDAGDSTTVTTLLSIVGQALEHKHDDEGSGSESSAGGLYHNPRIKIRVV
jgi:hypothetical protein